MSSRGVRKNEERETLRAFSTLQTLELFDQARKRFWMWHGGDGEP